MIKRLALVICLVCLFTISARADQAIGYTSIDVLNVSGEIHVAGKVQCETLEITAFSLVR